MMNKLRTPAGFFLLLVIFAFISFLLHVLTGRSDDLIYGLGVEAIGALLTALGIVGLEQLLATADGESRSLREQLEAQDKKIDELQAMLQTVMSKLDK